jgi:GTP cyclohydrolase I
MSLDKQKTDPTLGKEISYFLIKNGVETPTLLESVDDSKKIDIIKNHFTEIMKTLGLDLTDDSLSDSPSRVANMFVKEIFWGLDVNNFPKCTTVENKMGYDEMVIEKGIQVSSNCEHHFVAIDGKAAVAYIPNNKVLGLSKMNRIVEYFSKRPQIQERLTEQIYYALSYILNTENVAVVINAKHYCVRSRGVEDINCETITSKVGGQFKSEYSVRSELLKLIS